MKTSKLPKNLVYISQDAEGFTRVRRGKGFSYHKKSGDVIKQIKTLERIKALGIPPMWNDVWISKNPNAHLQATGYDDKSRKQYIYHAAWSEYRNLAKFSRIKAFGFALPLIREHTSKLLRKKDWSKEKIIALVIQMMDEYHIRIGNQYYKDQNETFGLTTLRKKHLDFEHGMGCLKYKAKSGKYRKINLKKNHLSKLIKECAELPGYEIFTYRDENNKNICINSHDVNDFLHQIAGEDFTSKDFRTWGGTVLSIEKIDEAKEWVKENPRLKLDANLIKLVAQELGNTQSVCREYYIHPKVLKIAQSQDLTPYSSRNTIHLPQEKSRLLRNSEVIVLNILNQD